MRQRNRPIQTNFTSGELSPRLRGRTDLEQYADGAAELTNFQVLPAGGITRRPGGAFVTRVKDPNTRARLVPFIVSIVTAFVLEFGQGYLRITFNRGPVMAGGAPLELDTPYATSELRDLRFSGSADILYITHIAHPPMKLSRTGATTFTLAVVDFVDGPYDTENTGDPASNGGTDTTTTIKPDTAGRGGLINVTASAALFAATDVGRALSIRQQAPERLANTHYGVGTVFYSEYNSVDNVYRVIVGGTTAVANMAGTVPDFDLNAPRDATLDLVDGTCTLKYLGTGKEAYGFGMISAFISPTQVTVDVDPRGPFASEDATLRWRLGEWNSVRGYPSAVTFYEERTVWAGSAVKPQTLWFSQSSNFETMSPCEPDGTVLDTDAITIALDDDQVNVLIWLAGIPRGLAVGAQSGEFLVGPASTVNAALSPSNIRAVRQTDRGSNNIAGIRCSGSVLFVQRGGRKLRELQYDFATDSFLSGDLTQLSDHIAGNQFLETAYQEVQEGTMWLVNDAGELVSLTYDREQKVRAWAVHEVGGTDAIVESVCCVPSPDGTGDDLYIEVARTVNGATLRTIEYIRAPFRADIDGPNGGFFVDCGLSYSGAPATTFSGLDHLDGETVVICADGAARPPQIVVNGSVSIQAPGASLVHIGLPYTSTITTLPAELPGGQGSAQGALKNLLDVFLRFLETRGGKAGRDGGTMDPLQMRPRAAPMSQAEPLYTGDLRFPFPAGADRYGQLTIIQDQPLPMTLLAIVEDVVTNA